MTDQNSKLIIFVNKIRSGYVKVRTGGMIKDRLVTNETFTPVGDAETIAAEAINQNIIDPSTPWEQLMADVKAALKSIT